MPFCSNCGNKLPEGAAFCSVCGAPQGNAQGVPGQAPGYRNNVPGAGAETFNRFMNEMLYTLKGMIIAPASTAADVTKKCFKESSFILGGLLMIIQGLLAMWAAAQAVGKLLGPLAGGFSQLIKVPYGSILLYYLLLFVIFVGFLYVGLHVFGCYIFKGKGSWISTWNIVAAGAVPFTAAMFLGILVGYIFPALGQAAMFFGVLIALFSQYNGAKDGMELSNNNAAFAVAIANIISLFVVLIIIGAIAGSAFGSLTKSLF